ncbi:MAG: hypothetical protein RhofKO_24620 [Rhodothermales bacterium]
MLMRTVFFRVVVAILIGGACVACTSNSEALEPAILTLHIGEELHLDGQSIAVEGLAEVLAASVEKQPTYLIYEVTPEAPMTLFQGALQQVRDAEITGMRAAQTMGGFQPVVFR